MKLTLALAICISALLAARAQEQPPWHPIQNTNALPTNAIVCQVDVLTADTFASKVHRHRVVPVSVLGYFALSWCQTNQPNALANGTLNYALLLDSRLSPTATFHIFGPAGKNHAPADLFDLERVGSIDLGDAEIRDFLAGEWYLVILNSGTPGGALFGRITP